MKKALITGITGQDGSYLAELLLSKGYEVHGTIRHVALQDPGTRVERIRHLLPHIELHAATMECFASIYRVFAEVRPEECYHLAAQSFVTNSFEDEHSTFRINIDGTHHVLSALRDLAPGCRFYFAGSSEMFGESPSRTQSELTPLCPRSAYGISKVAGFQLTRLYREAYRIHASGGILFNHESPRRGAEFVTRKVTRAVGQIKRGERKKLHLGNLSAFRDWGHAADYVEAMWLMLQQPEADDYVVATGETHSVSEFCELAFRSQGLNFYDHVVQDDSLIRPADVGILRGDASKAHNLLGWKPFHTFPQLVEEMVEHDLKAG